jgi:hypothetical protein
VRTWRPKRSWPSYWARQFWPQMRWTESQWLNNSYDDPQKYNSDLVCQVCFKKNHTSAECWHHFDESYVPEQKFDALAATNAYNIDTNWYVDSGATDHITGELEKLGVTNKHQGGDQIHMANGGGMDISYINHNTVYTPHRPIYLNNILYVPRTTKKSCFHPLPYFRQLYLY